MEKKVLFRYFTIFEHEKEQDFLRTMHKSGWKFIKVTGIGLYHFEKCEPEDVIYQLDYNQEGLAHKEEYLQMFQDCGWEHLQEFVGYSYFRKPASETNGSEEIFCDDSSRLHMMERVFRGKVLPLFSLFSAILIPQFFLQWFALENYGLAFIYGVIIVLYVVIFVMFGVSYWRYKNNVK